MKTFLIAVALAVTGSLNAEPVAAPAQEPKQIATMRDNLSVDGQSFRKGETFVVEKVDKVSAVAETTRGGHKYKVPLRSVDLQDAPADKDSTGAAAGGAVVIIKAQSGPPGGRQSNVLNRVRTLATKTPAGESPSILVSEALRGAAGNQTTNSRIALSGTISETGSADLRGTITAPQNSVLTVTYSVNGATRTAQGTDGQTVILK